MTQLRPSHLVLLGGAIAVGAFFAGTIAGAESLAAPATGDRDRGAETVHREPEGLAAENRRLLAELESLGQVRTTAAPRAPGDAAGSDGQRLDIAQQLVADIAAQLARGSLTADEVLPVLAQVVASGRIAAGDRTGALSILQQADVDPETDGFGTTFADDLAAAWEKDGNKAQAAQAALHAAKHGAMDFSRASLLARCDPEAGSRAIRALLAQATPGSREYEDLEQMLSMQMVRTEDREGGWRLMDRYLERPDWRADRFGLLGGNRDLWDEFVELDPAGALPRLLRKAELAADPTKLRLLAVAAAERSGNRAAAQHQIDLLLATSPYESRVIDALDRLDPAQVLLHLSRVADDRAPAWVQAMYAAKLRTAGRLEEATSTMRKAWQRDPKHLYDELLAMSDLHAEEVLAYARGPSVEAAVAARILGETGSVLSRAGRHAEARSCWQEAIERDPRNSAEWRRYLESSR